MYVYVCMCMCVLAGWAMQIAGFLFVDRHWETDRPYLDTMLSYFSKINYTPQFLLFPEGTDFDENTRARSDAFAAKNSLKSYSHVLHPRTTGFAYLVNNIRQSQYDSVLLTGSVVNGSC